MSSKNYTLIATLIVVLQAGGLGCQSEVPEGRQPVYPVHGSVSFQGKPATGAIVTLTPETGSQSFTEGLRPTGSVDEKGEFRLSTYAQDDGAPQGNYKLVLRWPDESLRPKPKTPEQAIQANQTPPPDRLKGRYADPARSQWEIQILDKENELEAIDIP